jgi:hypothetical protein
MTLRCDSHAQYEIRVFADMLGSFGFSADVALLEAHRDECQGSPLLK